MEQSGRPSYTIEEQIMLRERSLHDAQLIRGGAVWDTFGRLVITQTQLELAQKISNPHYLSLGADMSDREPALSSFEWQQLHQWLDTPTYPYTDSSEPGLDITARTRNSLSREGITTLRGIYIIGREGVSKVRNLGPRAVKEIEKNVHAQRPVDISWYDRPPMADIVLLSKKIENVPLFVLFHREDLVEIPPSSTFFPAPITVHDALQIQPQPVEKEADVIANSRRQRLVLAAKEFARKYFDAQELLTKY
jgi:hypothetical protein